MNTQNQEAKARFEEPKLQNKGTNEASKESSWITSGRVEQRPSGEISRQQCLLLNKPTCARRRTHFFQFERYQHLSIVLRIESQGAKYFRRDNFRDLWLFSW